MKKVVAAEESSKRSATSSKATPSTGLAKLIGMKLPSQIQEQLIERFPDAMGDLEIFVKVDLNGDGVDDYVISLSHVNYCGSGGCSVLIYMSRDNEFFLAFSEVTRGQKVKRAADATTPILEFTFHGSACNVSGTIPCIVEMKWDGKALKEVSKRIREG